MQHEIVLLLTLQYFYFCCILILDNVDPPHGSQFWVFML